MNTRAPNSRLEKCLWGLLTGSVIAATGLRAEDSALPVEADQHHRANLMKEERRQKRVEEFLRLRSDESGRPRPDLWLKAIEQTRQMKTAGAISAPAQVAASAALGTGVVGVQWTSIGPAPLRVTNAGVAGVMGLGAVSGEIVDIAIDPRGSSDQVIYVATNDGGIWKSTDGGTSWRPMTDFMPSLSMGAVGLDSGNPSVVYAGTGDPFDGAGRYCCFGSFLLKGVGIYKSTDAGESWSILNPFGIFTGVSMNRIISPAPGILLVATGQGLYRSVDGGANFG